ncbi:hypothetical protein NPIL_208481 [Nephila pilipes]|uniref:Uncharacterized protein n=1 Tax=Nephila pilipes TaxID=299642 RepID=A0A8X6U8G4_NEPPI|nr:hypothetical protein NPIL_208481 [Nephila pilipes]
MSQSTGSQVDEKLHCNVIIPTKNHFIRNLVLLIVKCSREKLEMSPASWFGSLIFWHDKLVIIMILEATLVSFSKCTRWDWELLARRKEKKHLLELR